MKKVLVIVRKALGLTALVCITLLFVLSVQSIQSHKEFRDIKAVVAAEVDDNKPISTTISKLKETVGSDVYGWLEIKDSPVDYPVMYRKNDSSYYLNHSPDGNKRTSGSLFIAGECSAGCGNLIIYGHKMFDQSMFGSLKNYLDPEYRTSHSTLKFLTDNPENGTYKLRSVILTQIEPNQFDYYNYVDLRNKNNRDIYTNWCQRSSLIPSNIGPGDLITLSTCSYHSKNGRLVLVFEKEESQETQTDIPNYNLKL